MLRLLKLVEHVAWQCSGWLVTGFRPKGRVLAALLGNPPGGSPPEPEGRP